MSFKHHTFAADILATAVGLMFLCDSFLILPGHVEELMKPHLGKTHIISKHFLESETHDIASSGLKFND